MHNEQIFLGNISIVWAEAFLKFVKTPGPQLSPLVIAISEFSNNAPVEDFRIRTLLDSQLASLGKQSVQTVANTIFPRSLWNLEKPRGDLYTRYLKIFPKIKRCSKNQYGIYFQRLIDFHYKENTGQTVNQIENIIAFYSGGNHRRSAFQASIWDPFSDLTNQSRRGFPCLQHVIFIPEGDSLTVSAFYATQFLFERAYGNYLGLCQLGQFIAHELRLKMKRFNCFIGLAHESSDFRKGNSLRFVESLKSLIGSDGNQ